MWPKVTAFLLLGYLIMTRSFAYMGLPTYYVFIGEAVLAIFLTFGRKAWLKHWLAPLFERSPLSVMAWILLFFFEYGVFQVLRGLYLGYPALRVLQEFVFHYYPLYIFLGLWVALRRPAFLPRFIRILAWGNGLYGIAYIFFLGRIGYVLPGTPGVPLFGQPAGSAVAILGLLLFEPRFSRVWFLLLLNSFVMLGIQVRAEWLGFLVGLLLLVFLTKRLGRIPVAVGALAILLGVGYCSELSLPSPLGRSSIISTQEIAARAIAPISLKSAEQLSRNAATYAGTLSWRTGWWKAIWASAWDDPVAALFGHGYGYPLFSLASYLRDSELRTPHNVFFYAFGYGGWIGVLIFFLFQGTLCVLLWRAYRVTGQPFGLAYWVMVFSAGLFGNVFETPYGAIPFYILVGLSIAPALRGFFDAERLSYPQPVRATRW